MLDFLQISQRPISPLGPLPFKLFTEIGIIRHAHSHWAKWINFAKSFSADATHFPENNS
jgi:hypothetical protein